MPSNQHLTTTARNALHGIYFTEPAVNIHGVLVWADWVYAGKMDEARFECVLYGAQTEGLNTSWGAGTGHVIPRDYRHTLAGEGYVQTAMLHGILPLATTYPEHAGICHLPEWSALREVDLKRPDGSIKARYIAPPPVTVLVHSLILDMQYVDSEAGSLAEYIALLVGQVADGRQSHRTLRDTVQVAIDSWDAIQTSTAWLRRTFGHHTLSLLEAEANEET